MLTVVGYEFVPLFADSQIRSFAYLIWGISFCYFPCVGWLSVYVHIRSFSYYTLASKLLQRLLLNHSLRKVHNLPKSHIHTMMLIHNRLRIQNINMVSSFQLKRQLRTVLLILIVVQLLQYLLFGVVYILNKVYKFSPID